MQLDTMRKSKQTVEIDVSRTSPFLTWWPGTIALNGKRVVVLRDVQRRSRRTANWAARNTEHNRDWPGSRISTSLRQSTFTEELYYRRICVHRDGRAFPILASETRTITNVKLLIPSYIPDTCPFPSPPLRHTMTSLFSNDN